MKYKNRGIKSLVVDNWDFLLYILFFLEILIFFNIIIFLLFVMLKL
jgi:hypothetical protein